MGKLININTLAAVAVVGMIAALVGCGTDAVSVSTTNNPEVNAEHLFSMDGCKVYRFKDYGSAHYFVKCGEDEETITSYSRVDCRPTPLGTICHNDKNSIQTVMVRRK